MDNDKQLCIGFTHFDPRFAFFWSIVTHCAKEEAERLGVKLLSRPAPYVTDQIIEIQKLLEQKIDALLITPVESGHPGLINVIEAVNAAGIPVVALDSGVGGGEVISTVRSDNIKGEEMVTEYIFERLGGKGKVIHLQGDLKVEVGAHRSEGFHNVLSRYPEIELVFEAEGNWYRDRGAELTQQALAKHPDIQAVIAANDLTALGAGDAIVEVGRTKEILVAGFDALPEALLSIYEGQMTATIQQDADGMACEALQAAIQSIRGEAVPSLLLTKVELITLDNLLKTAVNGLHMLPGVLRNLEEQKREILKANVILEQHRDQLEKLVADRTYELTRQQYILDTFMDNIPDRIYFKDTQSRLTRTNRALAIKVGAKDTNELIGKSDFDFYPVEQAEVKYQQEQELIKTGQPILGLEEPDGIDLWAMTTKMPLRDEKGAIIGTFGISTDITELVKAKQAVESRAYELEQAYETLQKQQQILLIAEKMASLGRLTAGIAHEMNTPLAAVRAALANVEELVKEYQASIGDVSVTDEDHYEIAREIHSAAQLADKAAETAAGFVRGIKSQTRTSAAERRSIDVIAAVQDALLLLSHALRQGKCTLDFKFSNNEIRLVGVPGRLEQIVTNLVNNAIDASYPQGGAITVSLDKHSEFVELQVSDHGSGILPENLSKIFDPMFSTKPFGSSTGLGLTIVHDIGVGEFGGTIDMSTQVGQGTTFIIHFPLEK